jgi:hypothetical protein
MSASKVLALTTLFLATIFAETEWKEFTSSEGNFRVVFPETPQQQKGAEAEPTPVQCCCRRRVLRTDVRGLSPRARIGKVW